jgi:hypothetical protein
MSLSAAIKELLLSPYLVKDDDDNMDSFIVAVWTTAAAAVVVDAVATIAALADDACGTVS